ncbi:MAG: EscU/YscU/HrcU family type III secretion system export apparatus switch protein [Cyanobacteriota bacterium]|nr:EscU/YscU/HrcU family type III secretion system export apparatus switch protein [Cyanobacteriota bacterium]MDY6363659.1 EscU/YscU/HrcU family type III secretion system export apparatus switch protein [Cyanobacteriota bacterium]MDY6382583.1 EscU/YscU/HrcU family type III secretion system export apparatus switch protein [Cyanobacteriota bacterium]
MGDEDKQFDATPRKLEQARKEGQVVKSKDFSTAVSLLVLFSVIFGLAPFIWKEIVQVFTLLYEQIPNAHLEKIGYMYIALVATKGMVLIIGPILAIAWLVAVLADFIQVGPLVAVAPLMPKLDKLNPTKYFKNIMSIKTLFELFKNIVKVAVLGYIGWMVYKEHIESILMLAAVDNNFAVMIEFGKIMTEFIFKACIAFLIISAADYGVTKWKFLKDQKMSFKEIKDEYKNSEGDPNVKAALRQRRMQMLQQGAMDAVPTADFVVTNPTHVACALKYVAEEMDSPMLIAKGTELIAKKIIKIAEENSVPVIENPPIARALFRMVDINHPIPPELYKAVAEILMFVYKMKRNRQR